MVEDVNVLGLGRYLPFAKGLLDLLDRFILGFSVLVHRIYRTLVDYWLELSQVLSI